MDISVRNKIVDHNAGFQSSVDEYIQWAPSLSLFALDAAGLQTRHNFKEQLVIQLMATGILTATVQPLKRVTDEYRPDSSAKNCFPSGHTATAFSGAEMLHQELKNTHPLLSYTGYILASATGIYRMYNNRHWLSDVIAGAGLGMLSTKASYWIFDKVKCKKQERARKKVVL